MREFLYNITVNRIMHIDNSRGRPYIERYFIFCFLGVEFWLYRFISTVEPVSTHIVPHPVTGLIMLCGELIARSGLTVEESLTPGQCRSLTDSPRLIATDSETWAIFFHSASYGKWWRNRCFLTGATGNRAKFRK